MATIKKVLEVEIHDEDHIYVERKQFISLRRFLEVKKDKFAAGEIDVKRYNDLVDENKHLKALLKQQLDEEANDTQKQ